MREEVLQAQQRKSKPLETVRTWKSAWEHLIYTEGHDIDTIAFPSP